MKPEGTPEAAIHIPGQTAVLPLHGGDVAAVNATTGEWAHLDARAALVFDAIRAGGGRPDIERRWGADAAALLDQLTDMGIVTEEAPQPLTVGEVPPLLSLHIELTNRCNLRCRHCYLSSGDPKPAELSFTEVVGLIDEVASMGGEKVSLSGGEPFMVDWLLDACSHAIDCGLTPYVFTNGTLFGADVVKRLARLQKVMLQISIEGPDAAVNDWIRGPGTYDALIGGIRVLADAGLIGNVVMFGTLNSRNIDKVGDIAGFAEQWGITKIRFTQINRQGRAKSEWETLKPAPEQWTGYGRTVERIALQKPGISIIGNIYGGLKFGEPGEFPTMKCECGKEPRVDCQGNVFPCQMFVTPEYVIGNIRKRGLSAALHAEELIAVRTRISRRVEANSQCRVCVYRALCGGGCPGHADSEFGDMNHQDSLCPARLYWFRELSTRIIQP